MKVTIQVPKEIEVSYIIIDVPVEYGEEDIPNDFPLRVKGPQLERTTALGKRLTNDRWEELELARVGREEHLARWQALYAAAEGKVDVAFLDAVLSQTEFTPNQVRGDE